MKALSTTAVHPTLLTWRLSAIAVLVACLAAIAMPPSAASDDQMTSGLRRGYRTQNYTYLGCYYDRLSSRDLPVAGRLVAPADIASCHAECGRRGFRYFALQHGGECWCGHAYGSYGAATEGDCGMACERNVSQICGGSRRNSVFETSQPRYIGCYRHKKRDSHGGTGNRSSLPLSVDSGLRSGGISRFSCAWKCMALGYPYFGLRAAGESCLCGTDYGSDLVMSGSGSGSSSSSGGSSSGGSGGGTGGGIDGSSEGGSSGGGRGGGEDGSGGGGRGDGDGDGGSGGGTREGDDPSRGGAMCSDSDRTAVYQVMDPGFGFKYIGCYKEKCCQDMNLSFLWRSDMSAEVCYFHCLMVPGALYFGLQDGDECHCSAVYGKFGQRVGCDTQCSGNRGQKCGGLQRNSVYQILQQPQAAKDDRASASDQGSSAV